MEMINDVLCNHHRDLLGHKYYCIRLHFFNIYSYGQHIARGLWRMRSLAGQSCSPGRARRPQRLELWQKVLLPSREGTCWSLVLQTKNSPSHSCGACK